MTEAEKLAMLRVLSGETDDDILSVYLQLAGDKICSCAYPFGAEDRDVPDRYAALQVEAAAYLLSKRGAEGETAHSENGISRSYENGDLPASMLRSIAPFVGIPQ